MSPDANDAGPLDRIRQQGECGASAFADGVRSRRAPTRRCGVRGGDTAVPRWVMTAFAVTFVVWLAGPAPQLVVAAVSGLCLLWVARVRRARGSRGTASPSGRVGRSIRPPARSEWWYGPRPLWPRWWR